VIPERPTCYVIAGPNGAGKTTFAMRYLRQWTGCAQFINADMIAQGLSPLNPAKIQITAGKLFLHEIRKNVEQRVDFAFETTLAGRGYARKLQELRDDGWRVNMFFLWIPGAEFSAFRVQERVEHGGHDISLDVIRRRYPRVLDNLFNLYMPLCDQVEVYNNAGPAPELIFSENHAGRKVDDPEAYHVLTEGMS